MHTFELPVMEVYTERYVVIHLKVAAHIYVMQHFILYITFRPTMKNKQTKKKKKKNNR